MTGERTRRPDIQAVFTHLSTLFTSPDLPTDPMESVREATSRYTRVGPAPSLDGVTFTPVSESGVRGEWVTTEHSVSDRRLLYIHGGGWCAGSPFDYRGYSAELARRSGVAIFMASYRLVPEHPFPSGLDDSGAALRWIWDNGPNGPEPAKSVALGGDSAGSNLAAASCALAIEASERVPDLLVLVGPALDAVHNPERIGRDDYIVTPEAIDGAFAMYMGGAVEPTDPRISPVYTPAETLAKFPPTLIQVSSAEGWLFDAYDFTRRLEQADVQVTLSIWPHMPHVWHVFPTWLPEAKQAIREFSGFISASIR